MAKCVSWFSSAFMRHRAAYLGFDAEVEGFLLLLAAAARADGRVDRRRLRTMAGRAGVSDWSQVHAISVLAEAGFLRWSDGDAVLLVDAVAIQQAAVAGGFDPQDVF